MAIEWGEAVSKYGAEVDIDELISDLQDNEEWAEKNGNLELQDNLQNAIMVISAMRYELNKQSMRGTGDSMKNTVDHPKHYVKKGRKEAIVEMEEKFGPLAVYWFSVLSAYKYRYRDGDKPGNSSEQDEAKALWYDAKADEMQEKYNDEFICRVIDEKFRRHENVPNDFRTGKEVAEQIASRGE